MVSIGTALLPGFLLFTLVYTVTLKILERRLTFTQSLLISAVACVVSIAIYAGYTLAKPSLGLDKTYDSPAAIVSWCILAIVVTRVARNYGIEKKGWLGLGGKANLWLLAVAWVIIGAVFGVKYLMG
jgi:hypothetical protein